MGDDIVLRLEFIKEQQFKLALVAVWCVEALAFVALIVGICLKATKVSKVHQCAVRLSIGAAWSLLKHITNAT